MSLPSLWADHDWVEMTAKVLTRRAQGARRAPPAEERGRLARQRRAMALAPFTSVPVEHRANTRIYRGQTWGGAVSRPGKTWSRPSLDRLDEDFDEDFG